MRTYYLLLCGLLALASCTAVPFTNRSQWNMVNHERLNRNVDEAYEKIKDSLLVGVDTAQLHRVQRVGERLSGGTETHLRQYGQQAALAGTRWAFLVDNTETLNAYALPGGKIVVTRGMLRVCSDDTLLAAVMGHEIGHVLANHTAENYSKLMVNLAGSLVMIAADVAAAPYRAPTDTTSFLTSYDALQSFGGMAHSRKQEAEADRIGMIVMALAAYPPMRQAVLWQKMAALEPGRGFSFENSHPTHLRRVQLVRHNLPEALRYWRGTPLPASAVPKRP